MHRRDFPTTDSAEKTSKIHRFSLDDAKTARTAFLGWTAAGGPDGVRWLDHAATTPRLACAVAAERAFYERTNANPGRGLHRLGVAATAALEEAREKTPKIVAISPDDVRNAAERMRRGNSHEERRPSDRRK